MMINCNGHVAGLNKRHVTVICPSVVRFREVIACQHLHSLPTSSQPANILPNKSLNKLRYSKVYVFHIPTLAAVSD